MKADIHPAYSDVDVKCSCGAEFTIASTLSDSLHVDICSKCHPFFTGQQKAASSGGRIDRFNKKFANRRRVRKAAE